MTHQPALETAIRLALDQAEAAAQAVRDAYPDGPHAMPFGVLEDHRCSVLGDLFAAIDGVLPGVGTRLQAATHPHHPNEETPS